MVLKSSKLHSSQYEKLFLYFTQKKKKKKKKNCHGTAPSTFRFVKDKWKVTG